MAWIVLYSPQVMFTRQTEIPCFFRQKTESKVDVGHFRGGFKRLLEAHACRLQQAVLKVYQALDHQCGRIGLVRG
ncbi:MAG: hypothetical protein QGF56_03145 [Verrucomicrobiota bacterium]|nr:hypothetical protein [Verrucomicrobiota bacterium]MDP6752658.1 hypothetical protein [Verrucomicrobiota bacterium]MDP7013737.1 hypothetical protein [Verrucomicrobiota bacterium]